MRTRMRKPGNEKAYEVPWEAWDTRKANHTRAGEIGPIIKLAVKNTRVSDRAPGSPDSDVGTADHTWAREICLNSKDCSKEHNGFRQAPGSPDSDAGTTDHTRAKEN